MKLLIVKEKSSSPSQKETVLEEAPVEENVTLEKLDKHPAIPILKIKEISSAPVVVENTSNEDVPSPPIPTLKIKEVLNNPIVVQSKSKDLASPTQKCAVDHPPIVLRISKVRSF